MALRLSVGPSVRPSHLYLQICMFSRGTPVLSSGDQKPGSLRLTNFTTFLCNFLDLSIDHFLEAAANC